MQRCIDCSQNPKSVIYKNSNTMKVLILPKKIIIFVLFVSIFQGAALTLSFAEGEQPVNQMERREQLELVKLKQEIKKLELENKKLSDGRGTIVGIAPFLTAIVALLGVFITLWRHLSEQRRQRDLDRKNLQTDRIRRFNEKFNAVVENLGSESQAIQASAAVSIQTFLKPEYSEFHDQVFLILLANLKVQHNRRQVSEPSSLVFSPAGGRLS